MFCNQVRVSGVAEAIDPSRIGAALEAMLPPVGGGEVAFYGGSFSLLDQSLQRACLEAVAPFVEAGRAEGIRVSTRPDGLGEAQVEFLERHGVTTVEIGCQSFCQKVLGLSGRGHGASDAGGALARLRRFPLAVGLQLMPGLPGAGPDEAFYSLETALSLRPDFLRIYPTVVLEGTELAELWRHGDYHPMELESAVDLCASMLLRCRAAGVVVIRIGLQGDASLDRGEGILAGPYHPAFGQLVQSRIWLRAFQVLAAGGVRSLCVHPDDLSDALGHRRHNISTMQGLFPEFSLRSQSGIPRQSLRVEGEILSLPTLVEYQGTAIDGQ